MLLKRSWLQRIWIRICAGKEPTARLNRRRSRQFSRTAGEILEARTLLTAPSVSAMTLTGPQPTNAETLVWTVTFSQPVTGVDASDFYVAEDGEAHSGQVSVTGSGSIYSVSVDGITGRGTIGLVLFDDNSIKNQGGEPLGGSSYGDGDFAGTVATVDREAPWLMSIVRESPTKASTNLTSVNFLVKFSEAVYGVDATDFIRTTTGTVTATQTQVTALSPDIYRVTVNGITGLGSIGIAPAYNGSITDLVGNRLTSQNSAANFGDQVLTGPGSYPASVALGDVNGDGKSDLVTANLWDDTVSILLGNGDGTFRQTRTLATGGGPWSVAIADLNGDHNDDIVVTNFFDGTVSVLLGYGNGSFQPQRTFSVGYSPSAVAVGDLNGDGQPDLAVSNGIFGGTVSVLLGNGNGNFQSAQSFPVGNMPYSVALGDVNGDSKLDIITANTFDNTISLLLGQGDGTFADQTTLDTGSIPQSSIFADLNNDGKLDILVANSFDNSISVLYGNGDGTFADRKTFETGLNPLSLATGDVNGDGYLDIVASNYSDGNLSILLGDAAGTFQSMSVFASGNSPRTVLISDLNGDDNLDLIVGNFYDGTIGVLMGNDSFFHEAYTIVSTPTLNDAPVITGSSILTYVEGTPATLVNPAIQVSDIDSTTLQSATVKITTNYVPGQDYLAWVPLPEMFWNLVSNFDVATGTLTLTSVVEGATVTQFQQALRLVTYVNTSKGPSVNSRTIEYQVNDGELWSNVISSQVAIRTVNSAPTVSGAKTSTYIQGQAPLVVNAATVVKDLDDEGLGYATVSITANYLANQDVLSFSGDATTGDITGSFDSSKGILTLISPSGTASVAQFQAALRLVSYSNKSLAPSTLPRSIAVQVYDGIILSNIVTNTINIRGLNQAPTLSGSSSIIFKENQAALAINGSITLRDVDSPTLSSATVRISANYQSGQDVLGFVNNPATTGNITGSFNPTTGILTLQSPDSSATIAQFQSALRIVSFFNASSNPSPLARSVTFQVSDGSLSSNIVTSLISIAPTNNAPTLTGTSSSTFTEGDNPVAIASSIVVSDVDNSTLVSATVKFSANFISNQDVLAFVGDQTTGNITGSFSPMTGTLTLISPGGTATLAQFQAALRKVTYQNTSGSPSTLTRSVTFQIADRALLSPASAATATIQVNSVSTPPVASGANHLIYRKGQAPAVISKSFIISDVDSKTLASATVQITNNYIAGEDLLTFIPNLTKMGNITGTFNPATGTLTLTSAGSTATLAQFQNALRAVMYSNSSSDPGTAPRTVEYLVSDGASTSNLVTTLVSITTASKAPVLSGERSVSYREAAVPTVINSLITIADSDSTTLASASVRISGNFSSKQDLLDFVGNSTTGNIYGQYNPLTGILTLISPGATATIAQFQAALRRVTYSNTSSAPSTLTRSITFQVSDGSVLSNLTTSTVAITAVANAPGLDGSSSIIVKEAQIPASINGVIVVSDVDSATIASATVRVTGNYVPGQDVLGYLPNATLTGNIVGSFDAVTGTMTLTSAGATATLAQFQVALRRVTYSNSSLDPSAAIRTISFQVNDGALNSPVVTSLVTIIPANSAPVVSGTNNAVYTQNDAPVPINRMVVLSDLENTTLASATIRIQTNYVSNQDVLSFTGTSATGNIIGSFNLGNGILTLISPGATATIAQFQAALRLVTYSNTSATPSSLTRTVTFQVSDGALLSKTVSSTVSFSGSAAKSAPAPVSGYTVNGTRYVTYKEAQPAVVINSSITLSGTSSTPVSSAQIRISNNFSYGQDVLGFVGNSATGNIVGAYNSKTGVLTLTSADASATLAQFQSALRLVTYFNSSNDPSTAPRTIEFQVFSGSLGSNSAFSIVAITPVNSAPTIGQVRSTTYTEDQPPMVISPTVAINDVDSQTLAWASIKIVGNYVYGQDYLDFTGNSSTGNIVGSFNALSGLLTLISPGATATVAQFQAALRQVTFFNSSSAPFTASRSIAFQVSDGNLLSSSAIGSITITAINDPPQVSGMNAIIVAKGQWAIPINPTIIVQDVDNSTLSSATVRITSNYVPGEDILSFIPPSSRTGNIVGTFNSVTGTLTLVSAGATATVGQFQAALRLVMYRNLSANPQPVAKTVEFAVRDLASSSNVMQSLITIKTSGAAPTISGVLDQAYSEDQPPVSVNPTIQINDTDSTRLASATVRISSKYESGEDFLDFIGNATTGNIVGHFNRSTGTLTLLSAGATATTAQFEAALRLVTYYNSSENPTMTTRSITFQVSDGSNVSNIATSSITIQ